MKKNEYYDAVITDLDLQAGGVCRIEDMVVFVPNTAIGDELQVKIVGVRKHYAYGILSKLHKPGQARISPRCPLKTCGGCAFLHISYEAELAVKEKAVRDAFLHPWKMTPDFLPILPAESRARYRNKAEYPFAVKDGQAILGFYAKRSHRVTEVHDCLLQPAVFAEICETVLSHVRREKIPIYNESTGEGILRHLYLRQGYHSGEIMVCFVVRVFEKRLLPLAAALSQTFPAIQSVVCNINPARTNVILGAKNITLHGRGYITDTICGIPVQLSPNTFYQVNTPMAEQLYAIAKDFASLSGTERVLDLYCGAGTIGLSMADRAALILGAEIVPEAVENARANAKALGIENAVFTCGDAGAIAAKLAKEGERPQVVLLDPPRKGCGAATLSAVATMRPKRIIMISCNPATCARDCAILQDTGFEIQKVQPVDMFPATGHVETVVWMSRKSDVGVKIG